MSKEKARQQCSVKPTQRKFMEIHTVYVPTVVKVNVSKVTRKVCNIPDDWLV